MDLENNLIQNEVSSKNNQPAQLNINANPLSASPSLKSIIGEGVLIKGDIGAKEDILIGGRVEGTVAVKNHCVEIGATANVNANIFAKAVIISGVIKGDIFASEQIRIMPTGKVSGSIHAVDICIEDGAMLNGKIDMEKQEQLNHVIPELPEENQNKSTFNFLFKKQKDTDRIDNEYQHFTVLPSIKESNEAKELCESRETKCHDPIPFPFKISDEHSLIGESMLIKGEVFADEDVVIHGGIDGVICVKNNILLIGQHALLKANIFAKTIITQGEIKGDMYSSEQVVLKKSAQVTGNLHSPRISVESGGVLMGDVKMEPQDLEKVFKEKTSGMLVSDESLPVEQPKIEKSKKSTKKEDPAKEKDQWAIF